MTQPIEIKDLLEKKWVQNLTDDNLEEVGKRVKIENVKDGGFDYLFNFNDDDEEPDYRQFDMLMRKNSLGFIFKHIEKDGKKFDFHQIELGLDRGNQEHMTFRRLIKGIEQFLTENFINDITSELRAAAAGKKILALQQKTYPQIVAQHKARKLDPPPIEDTFVSISISKSLYDGQFIKEETGETIMYSKFNTKVNFAGEQEKKEETTPKKKTWGNKTEAPKGQLLYIHPIKLVDPKVMEVNPKTGKEGPKVLDADKKIMKSDFHDSSEPKEYEAYVTRLKGGKVVVRELAGGSISISFGPYVSQMNIAKREKFERNEVDID